RRRGHMGNQRDPMTERTPTKKFDALLSRVKNGEALTNEDRSFLKVLFAELVTLQVQAMEWVTTILPPLIEQMQEVADALTEREETP
ncbi:MAG: hypothetical protein ACREQ5_25620, partial [Candidatus Dormibacteria bacterium]